MNFSLFRMLGPVDTLQEQVLVNQHLVLIFRRGFYDKHFFGHACRPINWLASTQIVRWSMFKLFLSKEFPSIWILILINNSLIAPIVQAPTFFSTIWFVISADMNECVEKYFGDFFFFFFEVFRHDIKLKTVFCIFMIALILRNNQRLEPYSLGWACIWSEHSMDLRLYVYHKRDTNYLPLQLRPS